MRALVILLLIASAATAAPKYDKTTSHKITNAMAHAEAAWADAAATGSSPARWVVAVREYDRAIESTTDAAVRADLAYALVQAYRNATIFTSLSSAPASPTNGPELAESETSFIGAVDLALPKAVDDEDAAEIRYLRGAVFNHHQRFDDSTREFGELVDRYPASVAAGLAADLMLSTRRIAVDRIAVVEKLFTNAKLLENNVSLATRVETSHVQLMRDDAERARSEGMTGDRSGYLRCAQKYRDAFVRHPKTTNADVMLYRAGNCYDLGHHRADAIRAYREMLARFPTSQYAVAARSNAAHYP